MVPPFVEASAAALEGPSAVLQPPAARQEQALTWAVLLVRLVRLVQIKRSGKKVTRQYF